MMFNEKMIALMRESGNLWQSQGLAATQDALQNLQGMSAPVDFLAGMLAPQAVSVAAAPEANARAPITVPNAAEAVPQEVVPDVTLHAGQFVAGSITNQAGTREYKLYVPSAYTGQALPLIVMLHGCSQDPDDFAVGTGMNAYAEEQPCLVLYPAQSLAANGTRCWNWFRAGDQRRDQGEPSIIADMTRHVLQTYHANPAEVYVAGLSAGGAMAIIMGTAYPDLYAAVGIHSGLPYASAQDLSSAMAAMQNGADAGNLSSALPADLASARARLEAVPVIVFHGDRDTTVNPRNSHQIMIQSTGLTDDMIVEEASRSTIEQGRVPNGHAYTRTVHHHEGEAIAEQWLVHGAGHAWSGGNRAGSFTDGKGPSATREMMRFFSTNARGAETTWPGAPAIKARPASLGP